MPWLQGPPCYSGSVHCVPAHRAPGEWRRKVSALGKPANSAAKPKLKHCWKRKASQLAKCWETRKFLGILRTQDTRRFFGHLEDFSLESLYMLCYYWVKDKSCFASNTVTWAQQTERGSVSLMSSISCLNALFSGERNTWERLWICAGRGAFPTQRLKHRTTASVGSQGCWNCTETQPRTRTQLVLGSTCFCACSEVSL